MLACCNASSSLDLVASLAAVPTTRSWLSVKRTDDARFLAHVAGSMQYRNAGPNAQKGEVDLRLLSSAHHPWLAARERLVGARGYDKQVKLPQAGAGCFVAAIFMRSVPGLEERKRESKSRSVGPKA
jgi:hypothetical protein